MKEEIICAGFGGQGIIFMGKLLAWAALKSKKFVTFIPSYGAEMRGGTANCSVIISDREIPSPLIERPTCAIVMNSNSLDKFEPMIKKGGLIIINSSLINRKARRRDIETFYIPATEIAEEIGNMRVANMVSVGAYAKKRGVVSVEKMEECLHYLLPAEKKELIKINVEALRKGEEIANKT